MFSDYSPETVCIVLFACMGLFPPLPIIAFIALSNRIEARMYLLILVREAYLITWVRMGRRGVEGGRRGVEGGCLAAPGEGERNSWKEEAGKLLQWEGGRGVVEGSVG